METQVFIDFMGEVLHLFWKGFEHKNKRALKLF